MRIDSDACVARVSEYIQQTSMSNARIGAMHVRVDTRRDASNGSPRISSVLDAKMVSFIPIFFLETDDRIVC